MADFEPRALNNVQVNRELVWRLPATPALLGKRYMHLNIMKASLNCYNQLLCNPFNEQFRSCMGRGKDNSNQD